MAATLPGPSAREALKAFHGLSTSCSPSGSSSNGGWTKAEAMKCTNTPQVVNGVYTAASSLTLVEMTALLNPFSSGVHSLSATSPPSSSGGLLQADLIASLVLFSEL
ncbi:hypothetical protein Pcinc_000571 [Petrolisthes cinctipes]|uniref:Uncharacterized protein n=1 Tax=Petrolisthes cinctipes TaxID=88211 RepID=A0AAE1GLQ6_PETCI|nr:hypothetical protein Pcinc_000571 [Petrolisthes cinctipes]